LDLHSVRVGGIAWEDTGQFGELRDDGRTVLLGERLQFSGGLADRADRPAGPITSSAVASAHLKNLE
jgi:hypothetical protein